MTTVMTMITVSKGLLKSKMLEYFRHVEQTGEELVVTDHRVPVLRVVSIRERESPEDVFADLRGKLTYRGSLTEPTLSEWDEF